MSTELQKTIESFFGPRFVGQDVFMDRIAPNHPYPPHDLLQISENSYRIDLAVAGFSKDEIEVSHHETTLSISGEKLKSADTEHAEDATYHIHRGISQRSFEKKFTLDQHIEIQNVTLRDGILSVCMSRVVPEEHLPKRFPIGD